MAPVIDHDDLADLFLAIAALHAPAELHGYASGFLALGGRLERDAWLQHCVDFLDCESPNPEQGDALYDVYRAALAVLDSQELAFTPLLPDDTFDLDQRVASLGQWCQGFLTGFAMAGRQRSVALDQHSEILSEALNDLAAIAQVSADEEGLEEGEQDFFAVCEYVRVAAMSIFVECNAANLETAPPPGSPRLH